MLVWYCNNHIYREILQVGDAKPAVCAACAKACVTASITCIRVPNVGIAGGPDSWDPKGLRERLCKQQSHAPDPYTLGLIADLIRVIDIHRPLGPDGKHDDRHTPTCGCDR